MWLIPGQSATQPSNSLSPFRPDRNTLRRHCGQAIFSLLLFFILNKDTIICPMKTTHSCKILHSDTINSRAVFRLKYHTFHMKLEKIHKRKNECFCALMLSAQWLQSVCFFKLWMPQRSSLWMKGVFCPIGATLIQTTELRIPAWLHHNVLLTPFTPLTVKGRSQCHWVPVLQCVLTAQRGRSRSINWTAAPGYGEGSHAAHLESFLHLVLAY